jgi:hypothetical protein
VKIQLDGQGWEARNNIACQEWAINKTSAVNHCLLGCLVGPAQRFNSSKGRPFPEQVIVVRGLMHQRCNAVVSVHGFGICSSSA